MNSVSENRLTKFERNTIATLSSVLVMRLIGLFMILPVLALYTNEFTHGTPYLIGIALGIYGLTQAIFQVPFGTASDRWGRRPLIVLGLIVFAIGSVVAALSTSIFGIILGRALQGAGTISAVVLAMVGDVVREPQRPKSMALVGVSIGTAFTLSLMLGPLLDSWVGIRGLFWIAAALAAVGVLMVLTLLPSKIKVDSNQTEQHTETKTGLFDRELVSLYVGTMAIHMVMTALFLAFPIKFIEVSGFARDEIWKVFVPVLLTSVLVMVPLIRYSSKKKQSGQVMILGGLVLLVAQGVLHVGSLDGAMMMLVLGLWLFFVGFNTLEALLPSTTVTKAPEKMRGTVMGIFNACTFIGAFLGGVFGGLVYTRHESAGVFLLAALVILIWLTFKLIISRQLA
ncbi:MAG: MFS transporter [Gammaproteobacteria bacterium]|nr:MFS transporter [Gammaproteobacteria bacterium]